nr:hypothetical protein [Tanacetum cinerariifolium]
MISSYHIIREDGSSKRYSLMIQMLQNIDREDVKTLWKLVKAKYGNTRPEEAYERVLWGDLKSTFCEVSKSTYLYAGREKRRIIRIRKLLNAVEVTAANMEDTTAGYDYYC